MTDIVTSLLRPSNRHVCYDARRRLPVAERSEGHGYDGEGQPKKKDGPGGVQYYIHGPGGQLLAEYRETPTGPELVREYIYLGSKLIASSTRVDPPVPTGRVTGVTAAPLAQKYGTSITITVTGWTTPWQ